MNKIWIFVTIIFIPFLSSKDYKGAEYRTKAAFTYGRFETSLKSTHREGILASFFTYHENTGTSTWNEIDYEIMGRYDNDVQLNTITPGQVNHVRHQFVNFNPHLDFHIYAFEWTPDYVAWFIDGIEVHRQTGAHIQSLNRPQKMMMNIWNPAYDNWAGDFNSETLPAFAYYDWASYYSYAPGTGNYGTDNNFTHQWTDNFDSWDQSRWDKATHTWDGNNCDFIQTNAVLQDSKLILCLTNSTNIGYTDIKTPSLLWARSSDNKVTIAFSEEVEQVSAENEANYIIAEVTIDNVALHPDLKNVELTVSGLDSISSYNVIVMNVKDRSPTPNTMTPKAIIINRSEHLNFPVKINAGGNALSNYLGDKEWSYTTEYGYLDGGATNFGLLQINETDEDSVYSSERWGPATYTLRVPVGNYNIKLMFAENYWSSAGKRIFDVYIEGQQAVDNLDIYNSVGSGAAYEVTTSNVQVNDGILNIHFAAEIDNPLINGIVVEQNPNGILDEPVDKLKSFKLEQNFPNPFNGTTVIRYSLSYNDQMVFKIYDLLGNLVFVDNLGLKSAGDHEYIWNPIGNQPNHLSSGVYFYSLSGNNRNQVKKLILLN
jgi:hypothetical protein